MTSQSVSNKGRVPSKAHQRMLFPKQVDVGMAATRFSGFKVLSRKGTGSQVLGSWNKEVRADSSLYRVQEAVAAVGNCLVRPHSALTLSVLLGMRFGYFGTFRWVFIFVKSEWRLLYNQQLAALRCSCVLRFCLFHFCVDFAAVFLSFFFFFVFFVFFLMGRRVFGDSDEVLGPQIVKKSNATNKHSVGSWDLCFWHISALIFPLCFWWRHWKEGFRDSEMVQHTQSRTLLLVSNPFQFQFTPGQTGKISDTACRVLNSISDTAREKNNTCRSFRCHNRRWWKAVADPGGSLGARPPLTSKCPQNHAFFLAILKEKTLFWAPWPKSWIRAWKVCVFKCPFPFHTVESVVDTPPWAPKNVSKITIFSNKSHKLVF